MTTLPIAALAALALSAPQVPPSVSEVIVTPAPELRDATAEKVQAFVEQRAEPAFRTGRLARWRLAVCPRVKGLPEAMNAFVAQRISEVAQEVGLPRAAPGCQPNVVVLFADDPQGVVDAVTEKSPDLLGFHFAAQRPRLSAFKGPIQSWHMTATRTVTGEDVLDWEFGPDAPGSPGSRFTDRRASTLVGSMVVADAPRIGGQPIGAVADYVAMVTLVRIRNPPTCDALPSILDLLGAGCPGRSPPTSMTSTDRAFLKALYDIELESSLAFQKAAIGRRMRDAAAASREAQP